MKQFEEIINAAMGEFASDIHIVGGHPLASRKNGIIQFNPSIKWTPREIDDLVKEITTPGQMNNLKERHSVDFATTVANARVRVNIFHTSRGLSIAVRILPARIPKIDSLNLHPSLHEICALKDGLVLICGTTGSGKTTTIAAIIDEINENRTHHIISLENPIEYIFRSKRSLVQQREFGTHFLSFEQGLLDVLREDSDVIVVGELREPETMRLTLNAAEAGHLVIATLHASTPEEALYRLCNAFSSEYQNAVRYQLASSLSWLIIQELITFKKNRFRVPLLTILRGTAPVKNLIRENNLYQLESAMQTNKIAGMFTSQRYYDEYLMPRKSFNPIAEIFQAKTDGALDAMYQSSLLAAGGSATGSAAGYRHGQSKHMGGIGNKGEDETSGPVYIDEDASMEEVIKQFEK